jgi:hypothetical protein
MNAPLSIMHIRVSCASLCRIEVGRRFLLLLNHNRRSKGVYQLSPIGGALEVTDLAFLALFGAIPENPDAPDLRFTMPEQMLGTFRQWFFSGQGRETSPFRELYEELVTETGLLTDLKPDDVSFTRIDTIERAQTTNRRGKTGIFTHYFLEIYDVTFNRHHVLGHLLSAPADSGACWLTAAQIYEGKPLDLTVDGETRPVTVRASAILTDADRAAIDPARLKRESDT